jgi:glucose-6-phosphate 1-dehydrogenase
VLRSTHLWGNSPKRASKRARYTKGSIGKRRIPAYVKEKGVDPDRNTETLAQVEVEVRNNRWAGIPFTLRSGKALGTPRKQIVAYFRAVPHVPTGFHNTAAPDKLIIDLKPGAVSLVLTMNAEGDPMDLEQKELRAELAPGWMLPYGEVLREILDGDSMLSVRGDAAESCWRILDPVLKAWKAGKVPMEEYAAGSSGPAGWLPEDSVVG